MSVTIIVEITNKLLRHSYVILARTNELPEDDTSCVETCRSSLFVISTIIVTDSYVHSLVQFKIILLSFYAVWTGKLTSPHGVTSQYT